MICNAGMIKGTSRVSAHEERHHDRLQHDIKCLGYMTVMTLQLVRIPMSALFVILFQSTHPRSAHENYSLFFRTG